MLRTSAALIRREAPYNAGTVLAWMAAESKLSVDSGTAFGTTPNNIF
eukprot:SAG31_NODE_109_length_24587_cov_111.480848_11_plen_47_part_00